MRLNELKQRRAKLVGEMRSLVDAAEKDNRDLNEDEAKRFETAKTEERQLAEQIERAEYLAEVERRAVATPVNGEPRDHDRLVREVSVLKVLRAQMEGRSLDGAEAEYAQEAERRTGRKPQGVFIPLQALERRTTTTANAGELVGTDHRGDQYINALRNRLLARQLGVRVLTGLQGDVTIPKHGSGTSVGWVAEGGTLSSADMTFDDVTLSPKHAGGLSEMSRQLLQQSSPDVEDLVRDDLMFEIAQAIDGAIIEGGGTSEPTGILAATGTQSGSLATPSWEEVLAMVALAEKANATPNAWLTDPDVKAAVAGTEKATGTAEYLYAGGRMADIPLQSTNQVPTTGGSPDNGQIILGDFSQILLGVWSEVDVLVNPYESSAYEKGAVKIRAMATVDVAIRHPQAFVIASDVVLS